jgi:hypothetical protein
MPKGLAFSWSKFAFPSSNVTQPSCGPTGAVVSPSGDTWKLNFSIDMITFTWWPLFACELCCLLVWVLCLFVSGWISHTAISAIGNNYVRRYNDLDFSGEYYFKFLLILLWSCDFCVMQDKLTLTFAFRLANCVVKLPSPKYWFSIDGPSGL